MIGVNENRKFILLLVFVLLANNDPEMFTILLYFSLSDKS